MAGFEDTAPSLDSVDLPSDLPTQNKLVEGATLYSLNDLRTAEEAARKAAAPFLRSFPQFPQFPQVPEYRPPSAPPRKAQNESDQRAPNTPAEPPARDVTPPPEKLTPAASATAKIETSELSGLFAKNFDRLDADSDGYVSEEEIDEAMASSKFTGKDALLVDVLKKHGSDLESLSNDEWGPETNGVSKADMAAFEALRKSDGNSEVVTGVDKTLKKAEDALEKATCREPFADKQNPLDSIKPEAIVQGRIQDSYFLSALASLAKNNPQAIASMIKDNGDKTYTVTFPGDPDNPVTVSAPTDAELARYAGGTQHGTWPAILEKAFGARSGDTTVKQDSAEEGSRRTDALRLLSTGGVDIDIMAMSDKDELNEKLSQSMQDRVPVTARIGKELGSYVGASDNRSDDAGLPCGQEYSVLGYDSKTQTVTLRNPRGYGEPTNADGTAKDGKNDGTFTMTLDEFQRNFSEVGYGQV